MPSTGLCEKNESDGRPPLDGQRKAFLDAQRRADYEEAVLPFLFWLAGSIIVICIGKDIARIGLNWSFVAIRLLYLPVALTACLAPRRIRPLGRLMPEFALWVTGAYIVWFCTYFSQWTGHFRSDYVFGIYQFFLGIALMPISRFSFFGFTFAGSLYYFAALYLSLPPGLEGEIPLAATNYVSFVLFSALIHVITSRIRTQKSTLKWKLHKNLESQERLIARQSEELAKAEVHRAVAAAAQMLAHDVRKPFSLLRAGLVMLRRAKDPAGVETVLARLVPEVDKAVSSVNGMIADVMEVGSTSPQVLGEPTRPEALIASTVTEIFSVFPRADVKIGYDLSHSRLVNVNAPKVGRVFSNIVGNALQAMRFTGEIWFKTRDTADFVEFCLGNAGSLIPEENLPRLFDAFFTSGKKGGTGLGLAIAQKIVTAHGGTIWCKSSRTAKHPDGVVEFFFTLPAAPGPLPGAAVRLPGHSQEVAAIQALRPCDAPDETTTEDATEATLAAAIYETSRRLDRPLKVLVVDGEALYRSALATYLASAPNLAASVTVSQADGAAMALEAARTGAFDLVITDVDMRASAPDGFAVVRGLRRMGNKSVVCVHSNRIVAVDHKEAIAAGADAFLPKPMARAQLFRLLLQAAGAAREPDGRVE
jgi:signal transduction histidine kinase/ActR/RegA family two-component response regulator